MIENNISIDSSFTMRVNFNLVNKRNSDQSQIWLTTTIKGRRVRVYTGLRIAPKYWICKGRNERGERALEDGNISVVQIRYNKHVNSEIQKILEYCHEYGVLVSQSDLQSNAVELSKETFVDYLTNKIRGREAHIKKNPREFIEDYIERKKLMVNINTHRIISKGTIYNHVNALQRLCKFCEEKRLGLVWDLFNRSFEAKFTAWLNEKNYAANTIASEFSIIKVWLGEAAMEGLVNKSSFDKFKTKTDDVDNIYLTEDEINRIYSIDFNDELVKSQIDAKSNIEQTRDLFIVACWTGLRYGDWRDLSKATISGNRMEVVTHKTLKCITIPLHPHVKAIIQKYGGQLPRSVDKAHTISQIRLCGKLAGIDNEVMINRIQGGKSISLIRPKYEFIANHTARRSFATNMYLKGVPSISIMAITGHTTETNFLKYIKVDRERHASIVEKGFSD